jgi:para-aminobenzoate synthetase/4-amino-4-deoxychorismate lyase
MTMRALLRDPDSGQWMAFDRPRMVVFTDRVSDVVDILRRVEREVDDHQLTAVGLVAYEAAPAFDEAFLTRPPSDHLPLAVFGLFDHESVRVGTDPPDPGTHRVGEWAVSQDETEYFAAVARIRGHIARGDTYQVNHTFRLRADFRGDPLGLFVDLVRSQPDSYSAFLDLGDLAICSASPELFFRLDGDRVVSRPMKGTAHRGWDLESDRARESWLARSGKNRAENSMITDMVRNDLGRVARTGSVKVTSSFDVERHPTVFQMTSTVEAETGAPVSEIMAAIFPFASVTGAPKIRTMELINELESGPRGVYTGAIGVIEPNRRARFSVAIRTAMVDRGAATVEYGVGSGVVWDSVADDEHRECVLKAQVLSRPIPDFELLETMLWEPASGYALLDRHLDRIVGAAEYFGRDMDPVELRARLEACAADFDGQRRRVRLLVGSGGSIKIEDSALDDGPGQRPVKLGLAASPVATDNPFLHFKTTHREVYETARASRTDCDDVLLWNERGEVTESTIANVVARIDDRLVTPPAACGLLPGTFRAELISHGEIAERIIRVDELAAADQLFLINSVQGWMRVQWVEARGS